MKYCVNNFLHTERSAIALPPFTAPSGSICPTTTSAMLTLRR
ncbi:hypothetical protein [Psychromicrobium xiongbiense]|nr:hypothetical protein [Psychromicrobium sp. YIM S02556]